ncbi:MULTISPECIES: YkvA family protein [Bacillaceae]|uniref:YkvA family protein n=1 Tax=Bacillaceae TaxID=186817 RepID=UPI001E29E502|nr:MULTISPECIES: YkvA family protein [Bacillaceae]MCE4048513.1 DUF1232 domain-containing protein [Bacillus sp. Au-Bac7]MCM3029186.1 YkvA family protein [Niallia sp. MER 6]MDL0434927.1 YkvA family protein [Niallia sp. SS-2023]UPO88739.1 DUF1232 domain-containing protein [Niallia sp. Man26]
MMLLFKKDKIETGYKKHEKKAAALVEQPSRLTELLKKAVPKATSNRKWLSSLWDKLQLLLSLVKAYQNGTYRQINKKSMVLIVAGLLYFLSPLDIIPDFIFGIGIVDDALVLKYVLSAVNQELIAFEKWKKNSQI